VSSTRDLTSSFPKMLESGEAANLSAYLAGIPIGDHAWTLREANNLVFLRRLNVTGMFGPNDGGGSDRGD
jgi:hypothetical protein